ncbi:MAG: histidine phosphatase family protein [Halieaceae bacterium]|jgi:broad specificity phosphatase PhoE|nr:histidine phosphatase family protein [Halieaceae bacterium]
MASVYLIRHGQASFGTDDYDRLSGLGCRQAEVLGQYFEHRGLNFDAVYTGELSRQRKTAAIAMGERLHAEQHRVDARFNEIDNEAQLEVITPILLEQRPELAAWWEKAANSSKDYQKLLEQVFNYWVAQGADSPGGLQSWGDYAHGARSALAEVMREQGPGTNSAIFTSGGTIATIVAHVLGADDQATYQFYEPVINCSVTHLLYNANKVSLSYYNDHSFLDVLGRQNGEALITYR